MRRRGTILLEIIVAVFVFSLVMVPLVSALCSNNKLGHNNDETLTSLYLCQDVLATARASAAADFDGLQSAENVSVVVAGLDDYRASLDVEPLAGKSDAKQVTATVFHRLGHDEPWRSFSLTTVVTRQGGF